MIIKSLFNRPVTPAKQKNVCLGKSWATQTITALAIIALVATGCSNNDDANEASGETSPTPVVIATTSIWADFVSNVACDGLADVQTIIPTGGDPHAFEPSLQDRRRMESAALIVANGLNLEEGLTDTIEAVADAGTPVFYISDHVETIEYGSAAGHHDDHDTHEEHEEEKHDEHNHEDEHDHEDEHGHDEHEGHEHDEHEHKDEEHDEHAHEDKHEGHDHHGHDEHEHEEHDEHEHKHEDEHKDEEHDEHAHEDKHEGHDHHGHDHGSEDPHIWFDPVRLLAVVPELSQALANNTEIPQAELNECTNEYLAQLRAIDAEVVEILSTVQDDKRLLVTNHDALGYFANRYEFDVLGTVIPSVSTLAATSPAALQELVEVVQDTGVAAIFSETTHSSQDAQALGRETGAKVVNLYTGSLGPSGSGADTYIGFLRTNAQAIADGLG